MIEFEFSFGSDSAINEERRNEQLHVHKWIFELVKSTLIAATNLHLQGEGGKGGLGSKHLEHQIIWYSTNAPSRFASIYPDGVLGPLLRAQHTWLCPCISVALEATHEASQGSKTDLGELPRESTENSVSRRGGQWFAHQSN